MNAATETATDFASTLRSLTVDDMIAIEFGAGGKSNTRTVRVSEIVATDDGGLSIYTTSGKVRPRHFSGGFIRLANDGSALFNATAQQQCKYVVSVVRLGAEN